LIYSELISQSKDLISESLRRLFACIVQVQTCLWHRLFKMFARHWEKT